MKHSLAYFVLSIFLVFTSCQESDYVKISVTTDVHGMIFPMDLVEMESADHSLAHVHSYLLQQSEATDTAMILLDNGDFLQGQPTVYFFNTKKRDMPHLSAEVMNFMGYDAGTVGNHDIETGPDVYYNLKKSSIFPG